MRLHEQEISVASYTHRGRKLHNEDCLGVFEFPSNPVGARRLAIVADGMGGHNAGELASKMAVETIGKELGDRVHTLQSPDDIGSAVIEAFRIANDTIFAKASADLSCRGMGTTASIVLILADRAVIANVGDSRVYLVGNEGIEQLSEDHTALASAMRTRHMTDEEIKVFPYTHAITRSLGEETAQEVYIRIIDQFCDSSFMICSDGLTDVLDEREIHRQVTGTSDLQTAVDKLGKRAYQLGSDDNITIVGLETGILKRNNYYVSDEEAHSVKTGNDEQKSGVGHFISLVLILIVLLLAVLATGLIYYFDAHGYFNRGAVHDIGSKM
jgi:PPM family protein phosphatase